ncbi:MAG TPA: hypothetical protein VFS15_09935, partial [Kofleriaceae bacterium]|nr:hypothetical protein [Kofleriaceae bacterium]
MTIDTQERHELGSSLLLVAVFGLIAILVGADLVLDLRSGTTAAHASIEGAVVAIGIAAATRFAIRVRMLARETRDLRARTVQLDAHLAATRAEAERWRHDAG